MEWKSFKQDQDQVEKTFCGLVDMIASVKKK